MQQLNLNEVELVIGGSAFATPPSEIVLPGDIIPPNPWEPILLNP